MLLVASWEEIIARRITTQSLFQGAMIRQGCRKKSYGGSLDLTLELTTSHGKNMESRMIEVVTLTIKILENPLHKIFDGIPGGSVGFIPRNWRVALGAPLLLLDLSG
jgi:hypothetical protein